MTSIVQLLHAALLTEPPISVINFIILKYFNDYFDILKLIYKWILKFIESKDQFYSLLFAAAFPILIVELNRRIVQF